MEVHIAFWPKLALSMSFRYLWAISDARRKLVYVKYVTYLEVRTATDEVVVQLR